MPTPTLVTQPGGPRASEPMPRPGGFAFYFFMGSLLLGLLGLIGYALTL